MTPDLIQRLRDHGVQPSAQRLAVAEYVLATDEHPSADRVWTQVKRRFPTLSRATVYNTLNLFVKKGLLVAHSLEEGNVVFDPKTERHHHFIDQETGKIHDVPWDALKVSKLEKLTGFEVSEYQVVLRGRAAKKRR